MRDTEDVDEIDVVLDILYNPETDEYAVLEKSQWHQENRDRYNPEKGGYPHEVPGGGIDLERPYTEQDIWQEGLREIDEETSLETAEVEPVSAEGRMEKEQDGVHHTFYAALYHTEETEIEPTSDENKSAQFVSPEEFYNMLGFNEIWALHQFHNSLQ
ncbi:MAG: NUDIX domain-containing protein [Candidatus Nanohalobium sp.]